MTPHFIRRLLSVAIACTRLIVPESCMWLPQIHIFAK